MKIFKPGHIGKLEVKNRIVMLPMGTRFADADGFATDRLIDYYEERANGGAGLIIVEVTSVDCPRGNAIRNSLAIDRDESVPGLRKLAKNIQKHGARAAIQIGHAGNAARYEITGRIPVGPSAVKRRGLYQMPEALTIDEIRQLVHSFAKAAERAQEAGFDGVEIHGAHLYLVSQFLSRAWNKRQDIYGGEHKNRVRFLKEIIAATRERVGPDFPLWCRINGIEEGVKDGTSLEEAIQTALVIKDQIDAMSLSAVGTGANLYLKTSPDIPGALLPLAKSVKEAVDLPIIGAGRLSPEVAEEALEKDLVDFIGMGRGLLCDPHLPRKLAGGNTNHIRPCIGCLKCYSDAEPLTCSVNSFLGNEHQSQAQQTQNTKKCFVAGGGPAGMTAAVTAAKMGHQVTLFEKNQHLGGQLIPANIPESKNGLIEPLTLYLEREVEDHNIELRLGTELSLQILQEEGPDFLIIATGVKSFIPELPGINRPNVVKALDILDGQEVGSRVAIIGGELVGCETAEFLAKKGKKVTIMKRGLKIAAKMFPGRRYHLLDELSQLGVTMMSGVVYEEITDKGVRIIDQDGKQRLIEADHIVIAAGSVPNVELIEKIHDIDMDIKIINIGDSLEPRGIKEAIEEGENIFKDSD